MTTDRTPGAGPADEPAGTGRPRVALVGVGTMGRPIAARLRDTTALVLWDAVPTTRERLTGDGYDVPAALTGVAAAEVVLM